MSRFHFPGYPAFLEVAAEEIGQPESAGPARRDPILSAISTLCAQAAESDALHVPGILAKAQEMSDLLRVAYRASELMLAAVRSGHGIAETALAAVPPRTAPNPIKPRGAPRQHA